MQNNYKKFASEVIFRRNQMSAPKYYHQEYVILNSVYVIANRTMRCYQVKRLQQETPMMS